MIKHKRIGIITAVMVTCALLFLCASYSGALSSVSGVAAPKYATALNKDKVLNVDIIADETQWAQMLENATSEEYIPATVIIDGVKLDNIGIRPKGNSSLSTVASNPDTDRYSFKLEFDHYINGQTWLGLDKLAINNMHGDASYMKEYLSYDIMSYIGVAAPLYAFTQVSLNGEPWGFYLAVEVLEESYAQRVYGNDHGMLYKPESMGGRGAGRMNEILEELEGNAQIQPQGGDRVPRDNVRQNGGMPQNGGMTQNEQNRTMPAGFGGSSSGGVSLLYSDGNYQSYPDIFGNAVFDASQNDYKRVITALEKLSNGKDLENVTDVEAVLRYFAAHTFAVNLDSYVSSMCHNYYLYEKNGQLTILPWDYNLAFGGFQMGTASSVVNFPIDTPVSGVTLEDRPLIGKLLEVPEYLNLYHEYLNEIVTGYDFGGTIDALQALISSYAERDPTAFYDFEAYNTAVSQLRELIKLRAESVAGQLAGEVPSTSQGQAAAPDKLIDASGLTLSALGGQGGGFMRTEFTRNEDTAAFGGAFGGAFGEAFDGARPDPGGDFNAMRPDTGAQAMAGPVQIRNGRQENTLNTDNSQVEALIITGIAALMLIGGIVFVFTFKRRKPVKPLR